MLGEQNVMDDNEDEPKPKRQRGKRGGRADRPSQVLKKLLMFYNHKKGEFSQRLTELKQVYRQKLREEVVELRGAAEGVIELGNGRYAITAALREAMLSHSTLLVDCVDEFMGGTKCRDRPQSRHQRQAMLTDEEAPMEEVSATEEAAPAEVAEGEDQYDDAESEDPVDLFSFLLRPQESVFLFGKFAFGKKGG